MSTIGIGIDNLHIANFDVTSQKLVFILIRILVVKSVMQVMSRYYCVYVEDWWSIFSVMTCEENTIYIFILSKKLILNIFNLRILTS